MYALRIEVMMCARVDHQSAVDKIIIKDNLLTLPICSDFWLDSYE